MSQQNGKASSGRLSTNANNTPHSQTLDHVTSYPLVSDLVNFYTHNSLGAKSIEACNTLYNTLLTPLLPYLRTPISIATPYLTRADALGDSSLSYVDSHFPAVKSTDYSSLKDHASAAIHFPFKLATDTKDYVVKTYTDESDKVRKEGGEGVVGFVKTLVGTEVRIAKEAVEEGKKYVGLAKGKAKEVGQKAKANGKAQ